MSGGEYTRRLEKLGDTLADGLQSLSDEYLQAAWLEDIEAWRRLRTEPKPSTPQFDEHGCFVGHEPRECGEHRTVGDHRAWCHDCGEWCYPEIPCVRCEIVGLRHD